MAKVCAITGKRTITGNTISHANNHTKRKWKPNLRNVKVIVDGKVVKMKVSARALRSGLVERA